MIRLLDLGLVFLALDVLVFLGGCERSTCSSCCAVLSIGGTLKNACLLWGKVYWCWIACSTLSMYGTRTVPGSIWYWGEHGELPIFLPSIHVRPTESVYQRAGILSLLFVNIQEEWGRMWSEWWKEEMNNTQDWRKYDCFCTYASAFILSLRNLSVALSGSWDLTLNSDLPIVKLKGLLFILYYPILRSHITVEPSFWRPSIRGKPRSPVLTVPNVPC